MSIEITITDYGTEDAPSCNAELTYANGQHRTIIYAYDRTLVTATAYVEYVTVVDSHDGCPSVLGRGAAILKGTIRHTIRCALADRVSRDLRTLIAVDGMAPDVRERLNAL